jgi:RNA polymerase sigma factor (sigma-70 family)
MPHSDTVRGATVACEAKSASGEEDLERLYAHHVPPLRRSLMRRFAHFERSSGLPSADVDDAIQEAFAKLLAAGWLSRQRPERGSAAAYLAGTVRNLCMDSLRARRREVALRSRAAQLARSGPLALEHPLGEGELESRRVELTRARIAELPTELSGYFRVRFAQGLSQRQAARHLGLTRRRARTLEQRLLTAVARHLGRVAPPQ